MSWRSPRQPLRSKSHRPLRQRCLCRRKQPRDKSTTRQNATCTAIMLCIHAAFESGSSPPFSPLTGRTFEARNAGSIPNSAVTTSASKTVNPATIQSRFSTSRAGSSGGLIRLTTYGASPTTKSLVPARPPACLASRSPP